MSASIRQFVRKRWWVVLLLVLLIIISGAAIWFWGAVTPPTPTAFYTPPAAIPQSAAAPGSIIRSEAITAGLPVGAVGWRIMYTSVGVDGEPIAVTGVVAAPSAPSDAPRPIFAFAQGTIGNMPACGISHTTQPFNAIPEIDTMISAGYVVVATDYPGRGTPGVHPYLIGEVAATSVLNSVRAARQLDTNAGDRFVVWGRSQGGHSALWTAQRAADYAPELTLVAAGASAPAIDLEGILRFSMTTRTGAIVSTYALAAWGYHYDGVDVDALVRPERREQFDGIARTCATTPLAFLLLGELPTPNDYLTQDVFENEAVMALIEQNTPVDPITVPLLIAHGTADSLIPLAGSEAEFARRCELGEDVQLVRYPGIEHDAADASALLTIGWFNDRLAGRATGSNCAG